MEDQRSEFYSQLPLSSYLYPALKRSHNLFDANFLTCKIGYLNKIKSKALLTMKFSYLVFIYFC